MEKHWTCGPFSQLYIRGRMENSGQFAFREQSLVRDFVCRQLLCKHWEASSSCSTFLPFHSATSLYIRVPSCRSSDPLVIFVLAQRKGEPFVAKTPVRFHPPYLGSSGNMNIFKHWFLFFIFVLFPTENHCFHRYKASFSVDTHRSTPNFFNTGSESIDCLCFSSFDFYRTISKRVLEFREHALSYRCRS